MTVETRQGVAVRVPEQSGSDKRFRSTFGPGALLGVIQELRHPSRRELISATGLARATVEARTEKLLEHGWVIEHEGESVAGRPPRALSFNRRGAYVLCLDVGSLQTRVGVADLGCKVLATSVVDVAITEGPGRVLGEAATALKQLMVRASISPELVLGVGIGVPSPVEVSGTMARPPEGEFSLAVLAWQSVSIAHEVLAFLPALGIRDVPVAVDKDANLIALGEWRTSWPTVSDLIVVRTGMHLSFGIIANGRVLRGATGVAGDLEHIPDPDSPVVCRCGQRGCLEATSSGAAIRRDLGTAAGEVRQGSDIVTLKNRGVANAAKLLAESGTRIGATLATAMSVLNPDLVVVGGSLSEGNPDMIEAIDTAVARRVQPITAVSTRIVPSSMDNNVGLVGAAHLVLELVTDPAAVDSSIEDGVVLRT